MGFSLSQGPFTYNRFDLTEGAKPDFLDVDGDNNKKESFKKAVKDKKDCGCKKEEDCDCSDKKKEVKESKGGLEQARKNVGADTCWDGYKAKGTKNKNGKSVPNCVKEEEQIEEKKELPDFLKKVMGKDDKKDKKKSCDESVSITKEMVVEYLVSQGYASNEVSAEILHTHVSDKFLESIEADISEGFMPLPKEKMARQANNAYAKEQQAVKSGDAAGANKQMQRRNAMQDPFSRKNGLRNQNANK